jgi:hypothetical protein
MGFHKDQQVCRLLLGCQIRPFLGFTNLLLHKVFGAAHISSQFSVLLGFNFYFFFQRSLRHPDFLLGLIA